MAAKKISSKTKAKPAKAKAATAKMVVKTASSKARASFTPAKKAKLAAAPAWPQAMSPGGAVTAHADGKSTKSGSANVAEPARSSQLNGARHDKVLPARTEAAGGWLAPWGQMSAAATQLMDPDAVKTAMNRQFQVYQTMARFSPLSLALQMMQGLLPADKRSAPSAMARR